MRLEVYYTSSARTRYFVLYTGETVLCKEAESAAEMKVERFATDGVYIVASPWAQTYDLRL